MCIILVKKPDAKLPTDKVIENCFNHNEDGAGIMYNGADKLVHITKGYMDIKSFKQAFADIVKNNPSATIVAHFRITTQGGVQKALTHPYALTTDIEKMKWLKCKAKMGIAHNGIISLTSNYGVKDRNDTMEFISKYLYNIVENDLYFYKSKYKMKLIRNLVGSNNKFAILDGEGHLTLVNDFITDKETGLLFSNSSYKNYEYKASPLADNGITWSVKDGHVTFSKKNILTANCGHYPVSDEMCDSCKDASCLFSLEHYR